MTPPENILGILPSWAGVYGLTLASLIISSTIFYLKVVKQLMLTQPVYRLDKLLFRLWGLFTVGFGQQKVLQSVSVKKDRAGLAHLIIFWGFLSFLFSYVLFIYGNSIQPDFAENILGTNGKNIYLSYIDILSGIFLVIIFWAIVRRWVIKPSRLRFDLTQKPESAIILGFIALLMIFEILSESFYIAYNNLNIEEFMPVGMAIANILYDTEINLNIYNSLHSLFWWLHLMMILMFAIYIPLSKHMHLIASPLSIFFRDIQAKGALSTPLNLEEAPVFGASKPSEFTWKEILDSHACAVCGRCTDACPANITGKNLSPMHIINNIKGNSSANSTSSKGEDELIDNLIDQDSLWDCLTCGACEQECPVGVEHIDPIINMRRNLVMEKSKMPDTALNVLTNLEQRGHPWKGTTYTRTDWTEGLDVKTIKENKNPEILLWVGCTPALNKNNQSSIIAMAKVLNRAKINFAILGTEESCTGDPARRIGNEYLYQAMAMQNINTLNQYNIKKIVTTCPHCFNNIKNEYPHLGGNYEVLHYSEFILELIKDKKIHIKSLPENLKISFHDPCYLGRHNNIYSAPRELIEFIPNLELKEMEPNKQRALCCGAGGGHAWIEETKGKRVNHLRTEQFLQTKADVLGVSCPFCMQMFNEGISTLKQDNAKVKDLIEIVEENSRI